MRALLTRTAFFLPLLLVACHGPRLIEPRNEAHALAIRIAERHGMLDLRSRERVRYSFHVQLGERKIARRWEWLPSRRIIRDLDEQLEYREDAVPTNARKSHHRFINDHYWLFFPWHLVFDDKVKLTALGRTEAPVHGKSLLTLRASYQGSAGYTPGDAYQVWFENDGTMREWAFYKGGAEKASRVTTWESPWVRQGLFLQSDRNSPKPAEFRIWFEDLALDG